MLSFFTQEVLLGCVWFCCTSRVFSTKYNNTEKKIFLNLYTGTKYVKFSFFFSFKENVSSVYTSTWGQCELWKFNVFWIFSFKRIYSYSLQSFGLQIRIVHFFSDVPDFRTCKLKKHSTVHLIQLIMALEKEARTCPS